MDRVSFYIIKMCLKMILIILAEDSLEIEEEIAVEILAIFHVV
jgi:hypothetical protein